MSEQSSIFKSISLFLPPFLSILIYCVCLLNFQPTYNFTLNHLILIFFGAIGSRDRLEPSFADWSRLIVGGSGSRRRRGTSVDLIATAGAG